VAEDYAFEFQFEGREYRLKALLLSEARAIQKVTGQTVLQFKERLQLYDPDSVAALIWVARKREQPDLRFEDVDGDLTTFGPIGEPEESEPETDPGKGESKTDAGPLTEAG